MDSVYSNNMGMSGLICPFDAQGQRMGILGMQLYVYSAHLSNVEGSAIDGMGVI